MTTTAWQHATNRPEGKRKVAHNRHAGHAAQSKAIGKRSGRRRVNGYYRELVEKWTPQVVRPLSEAVQEDAIGLVRSVLRARG